MIIYAEEALTPKLIEELMPILEAHREELILFPDMLLNVDWDTYYRLQDVGMLRLYTVRNDTDLIGYASFFISNNLHYKDYIQATCDAIYVSKTCRGAYVGSKLIKYADTSLLKHGVNVVYHHVKFKHDFSPLLDRQGYSKVETIHTKRLQ